MVARPARSDNGYRAYSDRDVDRLRFVVATRSAEAQGQIADLIALAGQLRSVAGPAAGHPRGGAM